MEASELVGKKIRMLCPLCFDDVGVRTASSEEWVKAYCCYDTLNGFRAFAECSDLCWDCAEKENRRFDDGR